MGEFIINMTSIVTAIASVVTAVEGVGTASSLNTIATNSTTALTTMNNIYSVLQSIDSHLSNGFNNLGTDVLAVGSNVSDVATATITGFSNTNANLNTMNTTMSPLSHLTGIDNELVTINGTLNSMASAITSLNTEVTNAINDTTSAVDDAGANIGTVASDLATMTTALNSQFTSLIAKENQIYTSLNSDTGGNIVHELAAMKTDLDYMITMSTSIASLASEGLHWDSANTTIATNLPLMLTDFSTMLSTFSSDLVGIANNIGSGFIPAIAGALYTTGNVRIADIMNVDLPLLTAAATQIGVNLGSTGNNVWTVLSAFETLMNTYVPGAKSDLDNIAINTGHTADNILTLANNLFSTSGYSLANLIDGGLYGLNDNYTIDGTRRPYLQDAAYYQAICAHGFTGNI